MYRIAPAVLNSRHALADLFNFFDELEKGFHHFLFEQLKALHTPLWVFCADELWLDNADEVYRLLTPEEQAHCIWQAFQLLTNLSYTQAHELRLFEYVQDHTLFYTFDTSPPSPLLHQFLSDCSYLTAFSPTEPLAPSLFSAHLAPFPRVCAFDEAFAPSVLKRLIHLSVHLLSAQQHDGSLDWVEEVQQLRLVGLPNIFSLLNEIMRFGLTEHQIQAFFQKTKEKSSAPARSLKLKQSLRLNP